MKKNRYAKLLLGFIGIVSLVGCSNLSSEKKEIPESTTVSQITETTIFETETTSESKIQENNETSESMGAIIEIETTVPPKLLQGYLFEADGVLMGMHEDAVHVLPALGDADNYYETPSCAFLGMDRQYTYSGYMITTYEENGREYLYDIYFLDETISTPEGIRIGSKEEEMIAAYGEGYIEDFGMYTYVKEQSKLQFLVVDGMVTSIDYTALTN